MIHREIVPFEILLVGNLRKNPTTQQAGEAVGAGGLEGAGTGDIAGISGDGIIGHGGAHLRLHLGGSRDELGEIGFHTGFHHVAVLVDRVHRQVEFFAGFQEDIAGHNLEGHGL